jgi:hypothetical protein
LGCRVTRKTRSLRLGNRRDDMRVTAQGFSVDEFAPTRQGFTE